MSDIHDLYQQIILDHNKDPRNYGELDSPTHEGIGYNPMCGDEINLDIIIIDDVISEVKFSGQGCAISQASASVMTEIIKGKTVAEVETLFTNFKTLVTSKDADPDSMNIGKLAVFAGVRQFPARVKCASLSWHTLKSALAGDVKTTTE